MPLLTTIAEVNSCVGKENEVRQLLLDLLPPVRNEQGCISFSLHVSHDDPRLFVLIAVWENYAAWQEHINSPRQRALLEESKTDRSRKLVDYWKSYEVDTVA